MALSKVQLRDDLSLRRKTAVGTSTITMRLGWLARAAFVFLQIVPKVFHALIKGVALPQRAGAKMALSRLDRDTLAYFENMSEEEARKERELEAALAASTSTIDIDESDEA